MIEFKEVYKSFGPKRVLNGLNLKIQAGEIFFILGRSGTGKSVSLKHLVGLLKPDRGEILLDGQHLERLSEKDFRAIRRKCSLVFQLPALLDSRTLFENLTFGIRHEHSKSKIEKTEKALHDVSLEKLIPVMANRYPPEISYGEQKRIALARSLLIDPDYILFDEPTTGLDPVTSKSIHELIKKISRNLGKTSVVVSHDMRNALATADRIVVMDAGQVVDSGTPEEIKKSPVALTQAFVSDIHPLHGATT
jgi:phospholipid/cholesterol/gamma-HCH transport system ATP-binding protein